MLPEDRNIPTVNTLIGPVARGSVLHKQLQGFQMASTSRATSCDPISYQSLNPAVNGSSNETGSGREGPDTAFPPLFLRESRISHVFYQFPESSFFSHKNSLKSLISTKANKCKM